MSIWGIDRLPRQNLKSRSFCARMVHCRQREPLSGEWAAGRGYQSVDTAACLSFVLRARSLAAMTRRLSSSCRIPIICHLRATQHVDIIESVQTDEGLRQPGS